MTEGNNQFGEQDISRLYSKPQVLVKLFEACAEGCGASALAEIIQQDTSLSARILQAANKTCRNQIDAAEPLTSAIRGLGLAVVKGVALQSAQQLIERKFSAKELRFLNGLWFSSTVASQSARCLAASVSYPHVEEAQLTGVLLNLGMHALFSREGERYVELVDKPQSSSQLRRIEDEHYYSDHLRIAEGLIKGWQLDSFLLDAVRFLHVEAEQIEQTSPLLKIARLAHHFSLEPNSLSSEVRQLGKRLFDFRPSEIDYLFDWAQSLFAQSAPAFDDPEKLQRELDESLNRLTGLAFALADQEGARARLSGSQSPEELARVARNIYLENSSASEALFFLFETKSNRLIGLPAEGQPRTVGELSIPLDATASLATHALLKGEPLDSLTAMQPVSVIDHLLLRLCQTKALCCQPFRTDTELYGVAVLGVENQQDVQSLQSLRLKMYAQVMTTALLHLAQGAFEPEGEKNHLLRKACHEVSNPLTIISNYAEVLRHLLDDGENRNLAESIKNEVQRIDDVLNYYLNQQELPQFPEQRVCLNQLVREAVESLQMAEIAPRKIDVWFDLQEDLEKVPTNPVLIKQVLVNLIKNAAEELGEDGVITLTTRDSYSGTGSRYAEIVVQDNGPGIAAEIQAKLFRPVVSTKGPGHAGVGLSIVKTMVDDLGAQIGCHSSATNGTGFNLLIPVGEQTLANTANIG